MANDRKFRAAEAAEYLGCGKSTLAKLRITGGGPRFSKLGKRTVVYDRADLEAYAKAGKVSSTSEVQTRVAASSTRVTS